MQGDDPPSLMVGTPVSAKYKGAFCEAKVSKVVRIVKCKVTFKMGLGTATVSDEQIRGTLRVGQLVQAKHPEKKEFVDATISKIQDCSQYTVVFDDGDITTLRRTALCLKSGRHFNESETLDQLPLTHPEHFGNPVVGGRRGRRSRQLKEDSSEGEAEEENEPDLELYSADIGRVVSVEASDKKRSKDSWFPGLVVMPSAQPTVRINVKDEFLVRSFKDGRYYTVPKKEVSEFTRELGVKVESNILAEAVEKALKYLDNEELPVHWERSVLFNTQSHYSDSEENFSDSSNDEAFEEKDHFVAQLYKFMDDAGTPLNKSPTIGNKDVDLYRLFKTVEKLGGYNRVTNQSKWRSVTTRLKFSSNQTYCNQVKLVYKKFLLSYEAFNRTLGVTMHSHPRGAKKNRGRSLIRDKDRATPMNSPRPDKEEFEMEKKEVEEKVAEDKSRPKTKAKEEEKKKKESGETSDTNSSDATDQSEFVSSSSKEVGRPRRSESRFGREKKVKTPVIDTKVKTVIERYEEPVKKEEKEDEKGQQTRSRTSLLPRNKEVISPEGKKESRTSTSIGESSTKPTVAPKVIPKKEEEKEKRRGRKRINPEDKTSHSDSSTTDSSTPVRGVNIGDKLKVYYGPTHESKVTYEAKVIEIDRDSNSPIYLVHYTGWNTRYDEWIQPQRIAENLSATTKAKRLKQNASGSVSKSVPPKMAGKRGRGMSITGRSSAPDAPRSTTPSSITSSSSRTKSPATPATRSLSRITRAGELNRRTRRTSAQTDISLHSETDSDESESETEPELSRTRSGGRSEDSEGRVFRRKKLLTAKTEKRKDKEDDDTEKEEEAVEKPKRPRRLKKSPEAKSAEDSDEESINPPKGRDFDLNQIRLELKGLAKPLNVNSAESSEKDTVSSDESSIPNAVEDVEEKKDDKSSSDDIYEFKEPEPFEFESRAKMADEKSIKKRLVPRIFEDVEKSPRRRNVKSPTKSESPALEKSRSKRTTPVKKADDSEEDEKKSEDPFDKLVESPSFRILKSSEKVSDISKSKVVKMLNLDEPLSLFKEVEESVTDKCDPPLDISDNEESQNEPLFSHGQDIFSESTFNKVASECTNLEKECMSFAEERKKDSDDDDTINASIQRVIAQANLTDDDSVDALLLSSPLLKKKEADGKSSSEETVSLSTFSIATELAKEIVPQKQISPALQETDSTLLESICAQPDLITTKLEDTKDINVKTGTKIADSILQKFNMIKSKGETKSDLIEKEVKTEAKVEKLEKEEVKPKLPETKPKVKQEQKAKTETKKPIVIAESSSIDVKKRPRKVVSREFIDSDGSDSSDSEQLVIARSDDDSQQTNMFEVVKMDSKESDSNASFVQQMMTDDSQSQDEEQRNFKFEKNEESDSILPESSSDNVKTEVQNIKEEEPDSHLHSLLLCEETIPGSPAPLGETPAQINENLPKTKSVLEMPFASAPGSSNSKNMLGNVGQGSSGVVKEKVQQQFILPLDNSRDSNREASTVMDNTPPTTPESTISNLSPRGENGGLSPNTADNESGKSTEAECDYNSQRRNSTNKLSPYSEEDTLLNSEPSSTSKRESTAAICKKRRRSCKASDDIPCKRGRKPNTNRSRHNSDSDDTSEHSVPGTTVISSTVSYDRLTRSPRPSKYNFSVDLDPGLDSGQRIALLQQKLTELRKTYADVKAELATIERRRKKIRRREREAMKAAKQEMVCT